MKFALQKDDIQLLSQADINFFPEKEYSEDEAFSLLDLIREKEIFYSQDADKNKASKKLAVSYGELADKIQNIIPEN